MPETKPTQIALADEPVSVPFNDKVRFWLAVSAMLGVATFGLLFVGGVAAGLFTVGDAKELGVTIIALFGVVSPIISFYFASNR